MLGDTVCRNLRIRFMARAIRLGYNVLSLDPDILVFDDLYK